MLHRVLHFMKGNWKRLAFVRVHTQVYIACCRLIKTRNSFLYPNSCPNWPIEGTDQITSGGALIAPTCCHNQLSRLFCPVSQSAICRQCHNTSRWSGRFHLGKPRPLQWSAPYSASPNWHPVPACHQKCPQRLLRPQAPQRPCLMWQPEKPALGHNHRPSSSFPTIQAHAAGCFRCYCLCCPKRLWPQGHQRPCLQASYLPVIAGVGQLDPDHRQCPAKPG